MDNKTNSRKKPDSGGQAAVEFLTTYGWVVLMILVAIGALSYYGILNPSKYLPQRCVVSPGFTCVDFQLKMYNSAESFSEVTYLLKNDMGRLVTLLYGTVNVSCPNCLPGYQESDHNCGKFNWPAPGNSNDYYLAPGERVTVMCNPGTYASVRFKEAEKRERIFVEFSYLIGDDTLPRRARLEIQAIVQPAS